jgi:tRNA nucleotidyltransferase (CCA-adding enzyme)
VSWRASTPPPPGIRTRLSSILRRPEIASLSRELATRRAKGWIVGGAVRDLVLGLPVLDVDVALMADPLAVARSLESQGRGTAVLLSESAPRVARVAGRRALDLAAIEGPGIREDLGRRDFTVNAVAIALSGGHWIDPYGGMADLAARRIRMISEDNLRDDPLRTLRAARLMATHDLVPEARTTAACARIAPALPSAAPERIRAELEKLLASPRVRPALLWAAKSGVLEGTLGQPLSRRKAAALIARAPLDGGGFTRRTAAERVRLRLALLAAAISLSPSAASSWVAARRFSRAAARDVGSLLELASRARLEVDAGTRWRWVRDAGTRAPEALFLARLLFPGGSRAVAAHARAYRIRRKPPRVSGRDLLHWLPMTPGPAVGELLREVEIEGLRGTVDTRRDARRWLLRRAKRKRKP